MEMEEKMWTKFYLKEGERYISLMTNQETRNKLIEEFNEIEKIILLLLEIENKVKDKIHMSSEISWPPEKIFFFDNEQPVFQLESSKLPKRGKSVILVNLCPLIELSSSLMLERIERNYVLVLAEFALSEMFGVDFFKTGMRAIDYLRENLPDQLPEEIFQEFQYYFKMLAIELAAVVFCKKNSIFREEEIGFIEDFNNIIQYIYVKMQENRKEIRKAMRKRTSVIPLPPFGLLIIGTDKEKIEITLQAIEIIRLALISLEVELLLSLENSRKYQKRIIKYCEGKILKELFERSRDDLKEIIEKMQKI